MSIYKAILQQAVRFHGDTIAVMETEIELPDSYQPAMNSWLSHPRLDGHNHIGYVGYDARRGRLIITIGVPAAAETMTKDEWLESQEGAWTEATEEHSTMDIHRLEQLARGPKKKPPRDINGP